MKKLKEKIPIFLLLMSISIPLFAATLTGNDLALIESSSRKIGFSLINELGNISLTEDSK